MTTSDQRFESLRRRARAEGFDVFLTFGRRLRQGERLATQWPDGVITTGEKIGHDDASLGESIALIEGLVWALSTERQEAVQAVDR